MSIPMKCEKCGAVSGFAPRFPCVHPPCDGERYLDKDALRTEVLTEVSPAPAAPGVDKLRYGPTADQMHALRTAFQNEWSGQVPGGFRRTVENVLTEVFQAGLHHESVRALIDAARAEEQKLAEGQRVILAQLYEARYAPLLKRVAEWQEAKKVWQANKTSCGCEECVAERRDKSDRYDRAEAALAAWRKDA